MSKALIVQTLQVNEKAVRVNRGGRVFLVAPVVAAVGGVMNGEWAPAEEFAKTITGWEGAPIVINHPSSGGEWVSASDVPDLHVGFLTSPKIDNGKFKAEAWFDVERLEEMGEEGKQVLSNLESGKVTEVSTAYFRDLEETPGVYNNDLYSVIQRNIEADHLAILPNAVGACSVKDGCGVPRVNKLVTNQEAHVLRKITIHEELSLDEQMSKVYDAWHMYVMDAPPVPAKAARMLWVREVFDDHIIVSGHPDGLLSYPYTMDAEGMVMFGDPIRVEMVYQPVGEMAANERGVLAWFKSLFKRSQVMNKSETIAQLVANGCKLGQATLEKLDLPELETLAEQLKAQPVSNAQPETTLTDQGPDIAGIIAAALKPLSEQVAQLTANVNERADKERAELVANVIASGRSPLSEATLKSLPLEELRALDREFTPADYSGRGAGIYNRQVGDLIPADELEA